jgi:hypothetical protein
MRYLWQEEIGYDTMRGKSREVPATRRTDGSSFTRVTAAILRRRLTYVGQAW